MNPSAEMARLFSLFPETVDRTLDIGERCRFGLDELAYQYPHEAEPGLTPQQTLERRTWEGASTRYPTGVPDKVSAQIRHELTLVEGLGVCTLLPAILTDCAKLSC